MAKQLYDYWFVQFDFPNEEGKPYKSSGGEMVWNEKLKRKIPNEWDNCKLKDFINLFDSKRIPLSSKDREERKGNYPYYGATGIMDYVNEYIFDGDYILLAEDGSTSDSKGFPIVQYIWGKNWVNNHAHIILPKNEQYLMFTYQMLRSIPAKQIETGSIQKKISQENLCEYNMVLPNSILIEKYESIISPLWEKRKLCIEEINALIKQRDELLPLLMNGQASVNSDFLVYMFPFYLKRALRQGLYKKYTHRDCNDANVRGTIDIPQHIKHNIPFSGNIAYKVKEYAYDNDLTQLIRHTIEYIRSSNMAYVLKTDADTEAYVSQICSITPSYRKNVLSGVIAKNLKSICHPYYTEYRMLQKLCINILHHKRLKYGIDDNRIYGLLFSGSWLWEEFLYKTVLSECGFFHPQNRSGKGCIYLFDKSNVDFVMSRCKRYPDYFKENCILDAKYKHLDNNRIDRNDMHQIISYMHVEKAGIGGFIFPTSQEDVTIIKLGNLRGYGGWIYNIGVPIPKEEGTFAMFVAAMTNVLQELKEKILTLC